MKLLNKQIENLKNISSIEILFIALMLLYILSGVSTPYNLGQYVNNYFIYASLLLITIVLYLYSSPIVALVFLIFSIVLINRSRKVSHKKLSKNQKNKDYELNNLNQHLSVKSLEEEMVSLIKKPDNIPNSASYHPVLCDNHNALKV